MLCLRCHSRALLLLKSNVYLSFIGIQRSQQILTKGAGYMTFRTSVVALLVFVLALAYTTRGRDAVPVRPRAEIPRRAVAATTLLSAAPFLLVGVAILLGVGQQISPCLFPSLFSQRKQQRSRL